MDLIEGRVALLADNRVDAVAAPVTLQPTPFSTTAFNSANEIQPLFNELVLRTIQDSSILHQVCQRLAPNDDFVHRLYTLYQQYSNVPKLFFNINRSDYMVEGDQLYQIELNTVSASMAGLSSNLAAIRAKQFSGVPANLAALKLAEGMRLAIQAYCQEYQVARAAILFVVQEAERNVFDQQELVLNLPDITIIRKPLDYNYTVQDGKLIVDGHEIGLVYYRAGYGPTEYTTEQHWTSRQVLESSRAIKCPDIASHLAGMKKIQQVLTDPQVLSKIMLNQQEKCAKLQSCFASILTLDPLDAQTPANIASALEAPQNYVLKPQREGGGNNIYGEDIRTALTNMSPDQLAAYILMQRIRPTITLNTRILRDGQESVINAVSELGIYGHILARNGDIIANEACGWLLRTKPVESDEGGLLAGYSVLDVPQLQ